ncbi:MAG: ARMT1-like domain-containing protein [Methanomassiliicoccus sp.]|nr:ARMT1-like domain-containing protein [Methanomassiliicoccus sp.]
MAPRCVPCLLGRVLFEVELCDPSKSAPAMRDSLKILKEGFVAGANSAEVATRVHERAYSVLGCEDPYLDLKKRSQEVAVDLLPRAQCLIESSPDRLKAAALAAIAGNVMDFGIAGLTDPNELPRQFDAIVRQGLDVDDLERVREIIASSRRVMYFLDNCGEDVLDTLLVREIRALGPQVTGVLKGKAILTDVTLEDGRRSGIIDEFDDIMTTGMFAVGVDVHRLGDRLRREMEAADLIICKGMANFESLSDAPYRPIAFLMKAKCKPVADAVGAKEGDNVVRLYEGQALKRG